MREEFKEITDYPIYQVTSHGRIYNTILKKFRKLYLRKDGYFYIDLYNNGIGKTFGVHRIVANEFCYERSDEKNVVNHKDGNKLNNYYKNLEWCTMKENITHACETGLKKINEDANAAILSNQDVFEIIELLHDKSITMLDIGNHYGVVRGAIFNIYAKLTWKNLTENITFPKRHNNIKLNETLVSEIKKLFNTGLTDTQIGEMYDVNRKTINDIKLGKTWKNVI